MAGVHAAAATAAQTDWGRLVALYDVLMRAQPSPVVALNRAVAVAMRDGPSAGLELVDAILARGELAIIISRTRRGLIYAGGLGVRRMRANRINGLSSWLGKARSVDSSKSGFANFAKNFPAMSNLAFLNRQHIANLLAQIGPKALIGGSKNMPAAKTKLLQPIPYLGFNGNCAEAMRYYEKVLGGTIKVMMSGAQSPVADKMPKEFLDRILNAQLELPEAVSCLQAMRRRMCRTKASRGSASP